MVVTTDRMMVRQCLLNLLSNACKFTENGTIRLTATLDTVDGQEHLTLAVSDTGTGMSPEDVEGVFDEFYRAIELVKIANEYRLPTFYQAGSDGVKRGFLLSISRAGGFPPAGRFLAATIGKVLNGASPGELNQLFEDSPNIAINLKTAEIIGLYLYADVLAAADEIYREIQSDEE